MSDFTGLVRPGGSATWPKTDEGWCEYFKALDAEHGTTATFRGASGRTISNPLHHDNRCKIHKGE